LKLVSKFEISFLNSTNEVKKKRKK